MDDNPGTTPPKKKLTKADMALRKLRKRKQIDPIDKRLGEAELREKYPSLKEQWEKYQVMLRLYR